MLFDPISYLLIASGVITLFFATSTRYLTLKNERNQQKLDLTNEISLRKKSNLKEINRQNEIDLLKNKITEYERKIMTSNSRIKNLKENMDYLVDIINQLQEK